MFHNAIITIRLKLSITPRQWSAFFCRFMLGLIFFMAGWFKCFQLGPVGHAVRFFVEPYAESWIPGWLLLIAGTAVALLELLAGALLILGWKTRESLICLGFILLLVTYGHLLKEPLYSIQGHIFPRTALLVAAFLLPRDPFSLDYWLEPGRKSGQ